MVDCELSPVRRPDFALQNAIDHRQEHCPGRNAFGRSNDTVDDEACRAIHLDVHGLDLQWQVLEHVDREGSLFLGWPERPRDTFEQLQIETRTPRAEFRLAGSWIAGAMFHPGRFLLSERRRSISACAGVASRLIIARAAALRQVCHGHIRKVITERDHAGTELSPRWFSRRSRTFLPNKPGKFHLSG